MKTVRLQLVVLVVCFGVSAIYAQRTETGFLNRTISVGGIEYRYQVFVPREFTRDKSWPVIVSLHGGGEYGDDGDRQMLVGLAPAIRRNPARFQSIVVFPQSKKDGTPGWQMAGGKAAMAALDKTIKEFRGDRNRVIVTGYSAGGNGTWFLASEYPERFAAAVVVCGFISEFRSPSSGILYPALSADANPYLGVAKKVSDLQIRIFHGATDDIVSPDESRKMTAALRSLGASVDYTEFPKANHNAWDPTYERADLIDWILKQKKK